MSSRMDKYSSARRNDYDDYDYGYQEPVSYGSRSRKNEELYQGMTRSELEDINLTSNAHVIGENEKNIDVEKIKELLEKNYAQEPRKSRALIKQQQEEEEPTEIYEEEETKEYNINAIIEKAKQDKEIDYERERLKKVRDTQYDILRGLSLNDEEEEEELDSKVTSNKDDLVNLINTITEKELTREMNPLDILTDLKGSDNTVVLDGINEEIEKKEKTEAIEKKETQPEDKKEFDKTFYTNSVNFSKSDFDDFNDLKEDMETNKVLIRVLLIIITIAFIAGILFFANQFFHLNWF